MHRRGPLPLQYAVQLPQAFATTKQAIAASNPWLLVTRLVQSFLRPKLVTEAATPTYIVGWPVPYCALHSPGKWSALLVGYAAGLQVLGQVGTADLHVHSLATENLLAANSGCLQLNESRVACDHGGTSPPCMCRSACAITSSAARAKQTWQMDPAPRETLVAVQVPENEAYEHSEMLLYKALVLEEGGREPAALQLLHDKEVRRFTLLCQLRSCVQTSGSKVRHAHAEVFGSLVLFTSWCGLSTRVIRAICTPNKPKESLAHLLGLKLWRHGEQSANLCGHLK